MNRLRHDPTKVVYNNMGFVPSYLIRNTPKERTIKNAIQHAHNNRRRMTLQNHKKRREKLTQRTRNSILARRAAEEAARRAAEEASGRGADESSGRAAEEAARRAAAFRDGAITFTITSRNGSSASAATSRSSYPTILNSLRRGNLNRPRGGHTRRKQSKQQK